MSSAKDIVRTFIVNDFLFGDADQLQDDTSFLDAGIVDSTGILELVLFLEEKFEIQVQDGEVTPDNFDSLNLIDAYLARKLG